jgi:hypothetical protein
MGETIKEAISERVEHVGRISVDCFPVKKMMFGTY